MEVKKLLDETLNELEQNEQLATNGGDMNVSLIWYNLYSAINPFDCVYPVGLLESSNYQPQSGVCTAR